MNPKTAAAHNTELTGDPANKPMGNEINPNHPVTIEMRELWFKICALLVTRNGQSETIITAKEVEEFSKRWQDHAVVVKPDGDNLVLRMVTIEEGERLAREGGRMPA